MQIVSWSLLCVSSTISHWFLMLGYSGRPGGTLPCVVKHGNGSTSVEAPVWRTSLAHVSFSLVKFMFSLTCTIPQLVQRTPRGANDGWLARTQLQTWTWTFGFTEHAHCQQPNDSVGKDWGCNADWSIGTFHCHQAVLGNPNCNYLKQWLLYKGQIKMNV
jgi:hypothetical protein